MANKPIRAFAKQKALFKKKMEMAREQGETRLILIIVANVIDPSIGAGCSMDIHSVRNMFTELMKHMKFQFLELVIKGRAYSKKNVMDSIQLLAPGPDDIVIFYYTGHGFRFEKESEIKFPQVFLKSSLPKKTTDIINDNSLNLVEIYNLIKEKKGRLNIVIGDCCNNLIHFHRKFSARSGKLRVEKPVAKLKINTKTCEKMFCDSTGSILAASADKGQFSITDPKKGSIFTLHFTHNLKLLLGRSLNSSDGLHWDRFLERTKVLTYKSSKTYDIGVDKVEPGNQVPIYEILRKEGNLYGAPGV
jgi:hypothetical protein